MSPNMGRDFTLGQALTSLSIMADHCFISSEMRNNFGRLAIADLAFIDGSLVRHGEGAVPAGRRFFEEIFLARFQYTRDGATTIAASRRGRKSPAVARSALTEPPFRLERYSRKIKFKRTPPTSITSPSLRRTGPWIGEPFTTGTLSPGPM